MISQRLFKKHFICTLTALSIMTSCSEGTVQNSQTEVTDIAHTPSKWQSIGNCWIYAAGTWVESMHLSATSEEINVSESYWTFWHWYHSIASSEITELETGGFWDTAMAIIKEHGLMYEGDFLPIEANEEFSKIQASALAEVQKSLKEGELSKIENRTPEKVLKVLEKAFGVNIEELKDKIHPASTIVVGKNSDGTDKTLDVVAFGEEEMNEVYYPQEWSDWELSDFERQERKSVLKRVLKALNDKKAVIMSFHVDFNALNTTNGMFEYQTLIDAGKPGVQGGHMVVIEDYVVENVPDGQGGFMTLGEGDLSDELKNLAVEGELKYFVVKNSWGSNRPERGLIDGETRLNADYLNKPITYVDNKGEELYKASTLSSFHLPAGY